MTTYYKGKIYAKATRFINQMKKLILLILLLPSIVFARDITLAWNHVGQCDEFRIHRSQGSAHWPELRGVIDCSIKQFIDTDIPHGHLSWVVTAYYNELESNASNEVELAYYYALVKFDYDVSGKILYKGENDDISAAASDTDWVVTKYYYNASGYILEMRVRTTSWDNRAVGW